MTLLKKGDFWQQNTRYRANARYADLVIYNDKFYKCITPHTSTNNFADNSTKFVEVSAGSGGLAGTWDMSILDSNSSTIVHLNQIINGTINGSNDPYILTPTSNMSGLIASTTETFPNNGELVFSNRHNTENTPFAIYFGMSNKEATLDDIYAVTSTQNPPTNPITGLAVGGVRDDNTIFAFNFTTQTVGTITDNQPHPDGQLIYVKYVETSTDFQMYAHVDGDSVYHLITSLPKSDAPNGIKPIIFGIYQGSTNNNIENIVVSRFGLGPQNAALPESNPVGKRYLVTHDGFFHGENGVAGEIAEFIAIDNVFFAEDANLLASTSALDTALNAVATSLQTQISAIKPPAAIKIELTRTPLNDGSILQDIDALTNSELLRINYDYTTLNSTNVITLNQLNDLFVGSVYNDKHVDAFVLVTFPTQTLNNSSYTLTIKCNSYGGNGVGFFENGSYHFNLLNTKTLLFRYIDGTLYPLSRTTHGYYGIRQVPANPSFSDFNASSVSFTNNGDMKDCFSFSDTRRVTITSTQNVSNVTLYLNVFSLIPSIMQSGVILDFQPNVNADISNVNIYDQYNNHSWLVLPTSGVYVRTQFLWNPMSGTLIKLDYLS